jgi:hypothetical protein
MVRGDINIFSIFIGMENYNICPICLDSFETANRDIERVKDDNTLISKFTMPCGHQFCKSCLRSWIDKSSYSNYWYFFGNIVYFRCPMCRTKHTSCCSKKLCIGNQQCVHILSLCNKCNNFICIIFYTVLFLSILFTFLIGINAFLLIKKM